MKKAPLTIVVPVRNRAQLVERTLASIAASTCAFAELIVVDNGSEDGTEEVCRRWATQHPEVPMQVLTEPRPGAAVARNTGLRASQTEYVYFFDSDDVFSADFIAAIAPEFAQPFDVLCVPVRQEVNGNLTKRPYRACGDVHVHLLNNMLSTQSMVFRKAFLEEIGGWNEGLTTWDDWELGTRVLLAGPRLRWHEGEAFHRVFVHDDSLTGASFTATLPAIVTAMRAVMELLKETTIEEGERQSAMKAYYLRCMIYGGHLRREGNTNGEAQFIALAEACADKTSSGLKVIGDALRWYAGKGGRGAWRIALLACQS